MGRRVLQLLLFLFTIDSFAQSPGGVAANLQLWLRAEDFTGGATWADASGNGRNAARTGAVTSTALYNFQNVPSGLTAARYFSVPHHTNLNANNGAISVIAVGLAGSGTYTPFVSKTINQYWDQGWVLANSSPLSTIGFTTGDWVGTGGSNVALQTGASTTIPYIASGFGSGATTNVVSVCNNSTTPSTSNSTKTTSALPLYIGYDGDNYGFNGGNIAEVLMYNANLTTAQRQQVWSYLAMKYGITLNNGGTNYLSSAGTSVWNTTTNSGYNSHIFGIARDNTSGLHQRQSQSINTGLQPVIAHGSTAVNLNSAGTELAADQSFLLAGADNGTAEFNTVIAGIDGVNARLDRIWRVQETGTIGTVTIAWPSTDASVALVVSNDAVFNGSDIAVTTTAITINGTAYQQASVDLTNGQYFTFAAISVAPGGSWKDLGLWLASDAAGVNPGSNAPDWDDISRSNNPVESVGTRTLQQPDATHNFQPYFNSFSTSSYFRDNNSSLAAQNTFQSTAMTMFAVARVTHATNDGRIMGIDDGTNHGGDPGLSIDDARPRFHRATNSATLTGTLSSPVGRSGVFSSYTSGTTLGVGIDGVYNTTSIASTGGMTGDVLMIGYGTLTVNGALPGDLQEVIWYKRDLSETERMQVGSYLALKHGITLGGNGRTTASYNYLNSAGTTVWDKVANSGYNNDIAGLGRDDASKLSQKQSTSANDPGNLVLALGSIATSNAANSNTFSQDRSFLVWGHDGGANNSYSSDPNCFTQLPTGVQVRIQRRWKVQATNFAQTVTVAFDQTDLVGYGPVSNLRLLVDDDGTNWTNATVNSGATSVGGRVTFSGVSFNTGSFFTLASVNFSSTPLPVELIAFEGQENAGVNHLTWRTGNETNSDHFEVERSANGIEFEWMADVTARGNGTQVTHYAFADRRPLNGLNYYRLMQVDVDGSFTYSPVIALDNKREMEYDCLIRTLDANGLFLFHCTVREDATLELLSTAGQPLRTYRFRDGAPNEVDLRPFAPGMYYARITDSVHVKSYKLMRP